MLKANLIYSLILFLLISFSTQAQIQIAGIEIPQKLTYIENEPLDVFGIGVRDFLWIDMYVGAVYLNNLQLKPHQIVEVNQPMALRLHILSSLISNKRIIKSILDGFDKSTQGNLEDYKIRIDKMINFFNKEINPGDIIDLVYNASGQTQIYRNMKHLGSIDGLDFKKALFGIWLSESPANEGFKNDLLEGI